MPSDLEIGGSAPPKSYFDLLHSATPSDSAWSGPCVHSECTFHQLSPYIGKLKSSIAESLITRFTSPGDIVCDPFAGSGTVPLEARLAGRGIVACDISRYAMTLTRGKLFAPSDQEHALSVADDMLREAETRSLPDLRAVPIWVRAFFHPRTLKETIRLARVLKEEKEDFLLSCLLGILHHQRPGFLSFPSSHLVPYLREKKFPREHHPDLYSFREIRPRLLAKIGRAFKRPPTKQLVRHPILCRQTRIEHFSFPDRLDCLITSPPYMNALDYGRDNRLRLWLLGESSSAKLDQCSNGYPGFRQAMSALAKLLQRNLKVGGHAVFVVGEHGTRRGAEYPSAEAAAIMKHCAPSTSLIEIISDTIPDVRRSRRRLSGIKKEHILIYRKLSHA